MPRIRAGVIKVWARGCSSLLIVAVMSEEIKQPPAESDLLTNSLLYKHFRAQREEILKHKWYESERAGHDIGFERALTDWIIKHRAEWLKRRQLEAESRQVSIS